MRFASGFLRATLLLVAAILSLPPGLRADSVAPPPTAGPSTVAKKETPEEKAARMRWYTEARFGLFIHWGLYAIPAGTWNGKRVPGIGEWIMSSAKIPMKDYQKLPAQFDPVDFDADAWVRAAKDAGMKYIIITAKHHDGFAMFKSEASPFNIVDATPFKRDPLQELAAACRKEGMRLGFYYSQAQDWNHPGGAEWNGSWDPGQKGDMDEYLRTIAVPQVRELLTHYGTVSNFWWDTPKDMTPARAAMLAPLLALQPGIITNDRLGGGYGGDTKSPEQRIPVTGYSRPWETCMTMNDTWGYKSYDNDWKSTATLVRNLIDVVSKGGNYLLNVGPDALGRIPAPSLERLHQVGDWLRRNGDSIYGATAGPFPHLSWGRATQKPDQLFLHVFVWPADGKLVVPMTSGAKRAWLLEDPRTEMPFQSTPDGLVLKLPAAAPDPIASVIVLDGVGTVKAMPAPALQTDASHVLILPSDFADLAGPHVWVEGNATPHLAGWRTTADVARWKAGVDRAGLYAVTLDCQVQPADAGSDFVFSVNGRELAGQTTETGDGYHRITIGALRIDRAGLVEVSLHPTRLAGREFMKLKSVTLAWQPEPDPADGFNGRWSLVPEKSSPLEFYRELSLETARQGDLVKIFQHWSGDGLAVKVDRELQTGGGENWAPQTGRLWPANVYMGVSLVPGAPERVSARWSDGGRCLELDRESPALASQGPVTLQSRDVYELSKYGDELTLTSERAARGGPPAHYVFKRAGTKDAYMMRLGDHWDVAGRLDENALLISLQGLANATGPHLYFLYPEHYDFRDAAAIYDFYRNPLDYSFTELATPEQALRTFLPAVKGYIVWDKQARISLDVAFTVAGLEKGIVVSADQIPLAEKFGLRPIADFRGRFEGKSDLEVFRWAYDEYGSRCNRDTIVWMGGEAGPRMLPGVADYGILKGAFFADLSTDPKRNPSEYALAKEILGKQNRFSMVFGWHSYAKDRERNYVTLTSSFADRVEGLNTLPNLSFTSQTPASPGFTFVNHHHLDPHKQCKAEPKVYLSCIQSDGLGLGAWVRPGRGDIPYAWEVTINWLWMCPTVLEYYYSSATPNDYFIGALSGPGYMYPKAIPPELLPKVISMADDLCRKLDLDVFETMDYSQGSAATGNTELTRPVVDAYYQNMPEMTGFANGYAPAFTFASRDGRPFVSFDYYLPEDRPEAAVARDLEELARINPARPYFLLIHVREWSDISRVESILNRLGPDFKDAPLDVFLKLAGQDPTFRERYLEVK